MKKFKNISKAILIVLPLFFLGCKSNEESVNTELLLTMKKTECLGPCPAYTVNFYSNGKVGITPKVNAVVKVPSTGTLTKYELSDLKKKIEDLKVESLQSRYDDELLMDAPASILTFHSISPKKTIKARVRVPESLKSFIKNIETLVKTTKWKPAS